MSDMGLTLSLLACLGAPAAEPTPLAQNANTWVKRSPLKGGPLSPGMGYEASLGYDPASRKVIRWGGHNQGGGGEQNAELWLFDPATALWELRQPNLSPPGVCCAQQNLFDPIGGRFLRFPAFSGSHGWQWFREIYLNNTSVWNYDPAKNLWRNAMPVPAPPVSPLRCASWDSDYQVAVLFGGEGNSEGTVVYNPYDNSWTRMRPAKQPAFRSGGNMAYDAAHKLHILFGSQFDNDPHTWAYSLARNVWSDQKPALQPPTDRNDPVLAYDQEGAVVIAVVRVVDKSAEREVVQGHLETWAYDAGKNTWRALKPAREPDGWGSRRNIMTALPDFNLLLLEHYVNPTEKVPGVDREQQIWTYRYGPARKTNRPDPPSGVTVHTTARSAVLSWHPSRSNEVAGYTIYRGSGLPPWQAEFRRIGHVGKDVTGYRDDTAPAGKVQHYYVCAEGKEGKESAPSSKVRTRPRLVEDVVVSVLSAKEVKLTWSSPSGSDIVGYQIERAAVEVLSEDELTRLKKDTPPLAEPSVGAIRAIGPFIRLTRTPVKETRFVDRGLDLTRPAPLTDPPIYQRRFHAEQRDDKGKPYRHAVFAYRVRAVNALGVEGGASAPFFTIPSAPQWLFSREEGDKCHLKWEANREDGIKGYRIYRMESPRKNGPGQKVTRVTAEPIRENRFLDPQAGKETRRYWVVAVDALGQEGFPSAPTWHERQYRKVYVPFVGEWHQ